MNLLESKKTLFPLIIITLFLMGCDEKIPKSEYDSMVDEKNLKIEELESEVSLLKEHISNLESKTEEVNNQFERLETENWRDVVPDAESSLEDLNTEISNNENY